MAGLYVHIPFCTQRCVYCDFYFVTTRTNHTSFVDALCAEVAHYGSRRDEPLETIYFGGGTPSLLSLEELDRIFAAIEEHFDTEGVRETTFEMNPEDARQEYLAGLLSVGVDRLSIGIQSFYDEDLEAMNRSHSSEEAASVIPRVRDAGFDNFSVDLIFGWPGQPEEYWKANLEKAVRMDVPHLSTYSLTVEPKTPLANQISRGVAPDVDEDHQADAYAHTMDYLGRHGYEHYEISSFARKGRRAVHNSRYWDHANYVGVGPSAHSFWQNGGGARRWANVRNIRRYEALLVGNNLPTDWHEEVSAESLANEYVMLQLRTADGLDLMHLKTAYDRDLQQERRRELNWLTEEGYIHPVEQGILRLTDRGKLLCESVTRRLI